MAKWITRGVVLSIILIVAATIAVAIHGPFEIVHTGADRLDVATGK